MFKELIQVTLSDIWNYVEYTGRKHGPDVLMGAGLIGVIAGTVMACRATVKAKEVVEEAGDKIAVVHAQQEGVKTPNGTIAIVSEQESKKELTTIYAQTGLKLAKLYAPAVILEGLGIAGVVSSHKILSDRNVAAAAAYTALSQSFEQYRKRVANKLGAAAEDDIRHGIEEREVEEIATDSKGKTKKVKKKVKVATDVYKSDFARSFKRGDLNWSDDPTMAMFAARAIERQMKERLRYYGHVFLNEVYDEFGWERTKAGNIYGWFYDKNDPFKYPELDFGIGSYESENVRQFLSMEKDHLDLDFNCIDILSGIGPREEINHNTPDLEEVA